MTLGGQRTDLNWTSLRGEVASLLKQTLHLAGVFQAVTSQYPPQCLPTPSTAIGSSPGQTIYGFKNHQIASFYVASQGASLILLHHMFRCLAFLSDYVDYTTSPEYQHGQRMAESTIQSLVASIHCMTQSPTGAGDDEDRSVPLPVWTIPIVPVFCTALASQFATTAQRHYLRQRLRYMADEGGIAQGEVLQGVSPQESSRHRQIEVILTSSVERKLATN